MSATNEEKIIAALLSSNTQHEAAEKAGISERTIRRYFAQADFVARFNEEKKKILDAANIQIQGALEPAIKSLRDILEAKKTPPSVKIQAARAILEYTIRLGEYTELEARIRLLESHETETTEL